MGEGSTAPNCSSNSHCACLQTINALQVWRGALLLADYVLAHSQALCGCVGLELGAGAGLAGLALAAAGAQRVFLTDVGAAVLDNCQVRTPC